MMLTHTARSLRPTRATTRLVLFAVALLPAVLSAQGTAPAPPETPDRIEGPPYGRVGLLFPPLYDENIFPVSQSQHPQSDLVSRFGPTFEVGRHSRRLEMSAK